MDATLATKFRFGDMAHAIATSRKALNQWLQRDLVMLNTKREGTGWNDYSLLDVAILSLVRVFSDFGMSIPMASRMANKVVDFFPEIRTLDDPAAMPVGALVTLWRDAKLATYPTDDGDWALVHVPNWQKPPNLPAAYVVVDVAAIWDVAFARAVASKTAGKNAD